MHASHNPRTCIRTQACSPTHMNTFTHHPRMVKLSLTHLHAHTRTHPYTHTPPHAQTHTHRMPPAQPPGRPYSTCCPRGVATGAARARSTASKPKEDRCAAAAANALRVAGGEASSACRAAVSPARGRMGGRTSRWRCAESSMALRCQVVLRRLSS